jgi:CubicO group peptidase (beta-lactamase class C family)
MSRMIIYRICIALIAACLLFHTAFGQSRDAQADELMAAWSKGASPGAAVLVIRDGRVLLKKGYGLSDIKTGEAINASTIFDLASVSKQFTAMGIMLLAGQRKLRLDDSLAKFFPEFPSYAKDITVRHLLQHTSGIVDYPQLLILSRKIKPDWQRETETASFQPTSKDVIALLAAQGSLIKPGEKWAYSNSNYVLLAGIIEKASGKSFPQFLKENIFQPLGMQNTFVYDPANPPGRKRATRYERAATGYRAIESTPFDLIYGDGNVHSTLDDLYKWNQALDGERLVKADAMRQIFAPGKLKDGSLTDYGFGWALDKYFGLRMAYHQGGGTGFNTYIMRIPDEHFTVVVLSNYARFNPFITGRKLARLYLADRLSLPAPIKVAPQVLEKYVGSYRLASLTAMDIKLDKGMLRAESQGQKPLTLLPLSETKFFVEGEEDTIITFQLDAGGNVSGITILQVDIATSGKKID